MLTLLVFLPLLAALALAFLPAAQASAFRSLAVIVTAIEVVLVALIWSSFEAGAGIQFQTHIEWIPTLGVAYHVGVDGISLPLVAMTSILFLASAVYTLAHEERVKEFVLLLLVLETTCLGVFVALDLIVFYLFWDLTLIAMFFIIALWGHEDRRRAALTFLIYTFVGSLALLLGIIGVYLMSEPRTFDMVALSAQNPLAETGGVGALILLALGVGFAIKTPIFPVHTWLPPAHVEAPAVGSAILAGVLLKMGTYGFVRIAMAIAPEQWTTYAMAAVVLGVFSVLYGALVALGQPSLKRLVAYTSINHMGYVVLAIGAAAVMVPASVDVRALAVTGAVTQMVAHGLVTGLLFLITGMVYRRTGTYEFERLGGLVWVTPWLATIMSITAIASFGIPGFAHFVAELQIFAGSIATVPVAAILAMLGLLITAGVFVWTIQRIFFGPSREEFSDVADLTASEAIAAAILIAAFVFIGVYPAWLLDVIAPAASNVIELLPVGGP